MCSALFSPVIAIDPHKGSWTAAAVDARLQPLGTLRVPVSRNGYRMLRRFARRWAHTAWAIEGATGLGAPLTARLHAEGVEVLDVPAKLAARVRLLSTGHGRKNDDADAVSVGIAALTSRSLTTSEIDSATTALRALVDHRDDLVKDSDPDNQPAPHRPHSSGLRRRQPRLERRSCR